MDDDELFSPNIVQNKQYSNKELLVTGLAVLRLEQVKVQLKEITSPFTDSLTILRHELKNQARMLERFHNRVSMKPIPALPSIKDPATILRIIALGCPNLRTAPLIARSIATYVHSRNTSVTALRASMVSSFTEDNVAAPVIEWKESNETENLAIFHFDGLTDPEEYSWLMHSGHRDSSDLTAGNPKWQSSRIDWNLSNIGHLNVLFGVAKHSLGVLEWPTADILTLCGRRNADDYSDAEMARYAKLLYNHLLQINGLQDTFNRLSPILQRLGRIEVSSHSGGPRKWRNGVSLYV